MATVPPYPLAQGWFRVERPHPGLFVLEEPLHDERVKSHLIVGERRALLLDTGMGIGNLSALVAELTDRPLTVIISHAHWDHVGGAHRFKGWAPMLVHERGAAALGAGIGNDRLRRFLAPERLAGALPAGIDPAALSFPPMPPDGVLHGGEVFDLGGCSLEVVHAPGHAAGLLVLLDRAGGRLFSTDAAYAGALYAHLPGSDVGAYRRTMASLAALAPELRSVYPAHGEIEMDPALLPAMRNGFDAVATGLEAGGVADGVATHDFGGFSILVSVDAVVGDPRT